MKRAIHLLLIIWALPLGALAQKNAIENGRLNGILPVNEQGKVTYQVVKTAEGVSKDELFKRARKWFVKTYNSPNQVLQINDPSTGELTGKGVFAVPMAWLGVTHQYPIRHLISLEAKEGKYRITLTDLVIDDKGGTYLIEKIPTVGRKWLDQFYSKTDNEASALLGSLDKALSSADDF